MSDDIEAWERDRLWLLSRFPLATEELIEAFCEKVAVICEGSATDENLAREKALNLI